MGQPIRQRNVRVVGTSEHFEILHVGVADILDIMAVIALDVANIARVEVQSHRLRPRLEGCHLPLALDPIRPFVGLGVPMHFPQRARALRHKPSGNCLGDGEIAEGSNWEAAELIYYYKLNNVISIVDMNRLGQAGVTLTEHNSELISKKFEGFGFKSITIDGHNVEEIIDAFNLARSSEDPYAIICKTYKGKDCGENIEDKEN